jgi:alpha-mannosidase
LTKAVINTEVDDTITYASSVYDIIKRDSRDVDLDIRTCYSQPNNGFVYKKGVDCGIAVYTKGLYEYENENNKLIKLSLLRSMDMISSAGVVDPKAWGVKDNLMLGTVALSFSILPFNGDDKHIPAMEQNINSQPIYHFDSTNIRMFTGGRAIVQDGDVGELYYPHDKYENKALPHIIQFADVDDSICITALKKCEKSNNVVLRGYNTTDNQVRDGIKVLLDKQIIKTNLAETEQKPFDNVINKKEIVTVILK